MSDIIYDVPTSSEFEQYILPAAMQASDRDVLFQNIEGNLFQYINPEERCFFISLNPSLSREGYIKLEDRSFFKNTKSLELFKIDYDVNYLNYSQIHEKSSEFLEEIRKSYPLILASWSCGSTQISRVVEDGEQKSYLFCMPFFQIDIFYNQKLFSVFPFIDNYCALINRSGSFSSEVQELLATIKNCFLTIFSKQNESN